MEAEKLKKIRDLLLEFMTIKEREDGDHLPICINCKHWRDKSWTNKGWGVCDNPLNEVNVSCSSLITFYVKDEEVQTELRNELEQGIRYPEDFGCIFFEPK